MSALAESVGVEGGGARGKNRRNNWEILQGSRLVWQPVSGMHNREGCFGWKSDGLIVALKGGNAPGAKEPCCKHAFINEERAA